MALTGRRARVPLGMRRSPGCPVNTLDTSGSSPTIVPGPRSLLGGRRAGVTTNSLDQVMLDRKGFTSIKNRAHRPFGHTYGALSRILGAIAQTEVMVLRCRVVGWTGRPPSRAGGQREPDGCSLRWFRPLLPSTDPGGPGEPSGALRRPPGAPPRPRPGGRTDGGRASESPVRERG